MCVYVFPYMSVSADACSGEVRLNLTVIKQQVSMKAKYI